VSWSKEAKVVPIKTEMEIALRASGARRKEKIVSKSPGQNPARISFVQEKFQEESARRVIEFSTIPIEETATAGGEAQPASSLKPFGGMSHPHDRRAPAAGDARSGAPFEIEEERAARLHRSTGPRPRPSRLSCEERGEAEQGGLETP